VWPDDGTDYDHPFLRLPRHIAIASVPYTDYYMEASTHDDGGASGVVTRNRTASMYPDYESGYRELVNLEDRNPLDARRFQARSGNTTATVFIAVDGDTFGDILLVEAGGMSGQTPPNGCRTSCSLVYADSGHIVAYNAWGGSARGWVNHSDTDWFSDPIDGLESSADLLLYAAVVGIVLYIIYRAVRAAAAAYKDA